MPLPELHEQGNFYSRRDGVSHSIAFVDPSLVTAEEDLSRREITDALLVSFGGVVTEPLRPTADKAGEQVAVPDPEVFSLERDPRTYEVRVTSDITPEDYRNITSARDWALLQESIAPLRGKKVVAVGSTFRGGGVAMIRPPQINLMKREGVNIHWFIMEPDDEAFEVTKKMHNLQQDVLGPGAQFTDENRAVHQRLGVENFEHLKEQENFKDADIYVIDDSQPAAMILRIRELYPNAMIVFRNHIQTDRDLMAQAGSPQRAIYEYLHDVCGVGTVDAYVAHPVEQFVPHDTPNVVHMPPTSDPFEDLNRPLTDAEIEEGLDFFDAEIERQNRERRAQNGNSLDDQDPLDRDRLRLTLFARFDLAKGMPIAMELEKRIIAKLVEQNAPEGKLPELLIAGNGSVDDKDRAWMIDRMLEHRRERYGAIQRYIKILGVSHNYAAVNAVMRTSMFSMNPSTKEGFEHRATESIIKGVPAIVSNRGGLPLQVTDGVSGFVMNLDSLASIDDLDGIDGELERVAEVVVGCILDPDKYRALQESTQAESRAYNEREISTVANVIRWARTFRGLGSRRWLLDDLAAEQEALAA